MINDYQNYYYKYVLTQLLSLEKLQIEHIPN